jgi:hypothetical protein
MRNEIVLRTDRGVRRVPASVRQAVELQQYRGLEASARVKAAAYVAHVGMTLTTQLSAEEGLLIQQCPLAEPRLKPIVDQFALLACVEVAEIGY